MFCKKPEISAQGVIALVMAAGKSRRFGSDKRQARMADGRSILQTTLAVARQNFTETLVVVRADDNLGALQLPDQIEVLRAPPSGIGLGVSLATAFRYLLNRKTQAVAAAVILADMPWVSGAICQRLAARADAERIVYPSFRSQQGHPVIIGRNFWPALSGLQGDQGAQCLIRDNAARCDVLAVDSDTVLRDVDLPADLFY